MLSLSKLVGELSKSTLDEDLVKFKEFSRFKETSGLDGKFDDMKATIDPSGVARLPRSDNDDSLKRPSQESAEEPPNKKVSCTNKPVGKSINEWEDQEFIDRVSLLYTVILSNPYQKKGGVKVQVNHFLAYVCLRLDSGVGEFYDPEARNPEIMRLRAHDEKKNMRWFQWLNEHLYISAERYAEIKENGNAFYWKRQSNAQNTKQRHYFCCQISKQMGVSWDTNMPAPDGMVPLGKKKIEV